MGTIEKEKRDTKMTTQSWNALPAQVLEILYPSCAAKLSLSVIFFHSCFSLKALLSHLQGELLVEKNQLLAPTEVIMPFLSPTFPHLAQMQRLSFKAQQQSTRRHKGLRGLQKLHPGCQNKQQPRGKLMSFQCGCSK